MWKIKVLIILLMGMFNSCKSQNLETCSLNVDYEFKGEKENKIENVILVLETGFDDYLEIFVNDELIQKGLYVTNREYGTAGEVIDYQYEKNDLPSFMIKTEKGCLAFKANENYRIIFLHKGEDSWIVEYRNEFKIIE
ncbi:hypothetical protein [Christiangramia sp. SM2212]|uniref:Uncharacterized protein n=1 Tax=Christiangramia sediminicola TaxID=3073267 RepID=A0ABU1EUL1_9FLAO|nr:hypothetical protein [Christiangramia sp. SM2212]MDR5591669.1 hypothetical protein [Christiangramia sp. SM2212]